MLNRLIILLFGLYAVSSVDAAQIPCWKLIWETGAVHGEDPELVYANGLKVTGARQYPLETVLFDLDIDSNVMASVAEADGLLVGEGFSPLLEHVVANGGVRIRAVDLWYEEVSFPDTIDGLAMKAYIDRNRGYLVKGNALELPFADNSQDYLWSHLLVNNLDDDSQRATEEMVRVLRPNGEGRVFGFRYDFGLQVFIRKLRNQGHEVRDLRKTIVLHNVEGTIEIPLVLLIIRKGVAQ